VPLHRSDSGDAISIRYQIGDFWQVHVIDGGFTSTGPDFAAHIRIAVPLLLLSVVYAYRAYRFGVHSAREMFVQFLVLDGSPSANAPEE
jgi:hypothetical protein